MKSLFFGLSALIFVSQVSFAAKDEPNLSINGQRQNSTGGKALPSQPAAPSITADHSAISLFRDTYSKNYLDEKADVEKYCKELMTKVVGDLEDSILSGHLLKGKLNGNFQYACKAITIVVRTGSDSDSDVEFRGFFWLPSDVSIWHDFLGAVEVFCTPRDLREQKIVSDMQSFEQSPDPAMYNAIMAEMKTIQPTQWYRDYKNSCLEN